MMNEKAPRPSPKLAARPPEASLSPRGRAAPDLLALQRTLGNRRVVEVLSADRGRPASGDAEEREADVIAADVVRRMERGPLPDEPHQEGRLAQPSRGAREHLPTSRPSAPSGGAVQRKAMMPIAGAGTAVSPSIEAAIAGARGGGQPISDGLRTPVERAFGMRFDGVRLHTDERADHMSRALHARAFTSGNDVFFRRGEYQPDTHDGRELIAHELTHTVQQGGARPGVVQRKVMVGTREYKAGEEKELWEALQARFPQLAQHIRTDTAARLHEMITSPEEIPLQRVGERLIASEPHLQRSDQKLDEAPSSSEPATLSAPVSASAPEEFQIFVKDLVGKTQTFDVTAEHTVVQLKRMFFERVLGKDEPTSEDLGGLKLAFASRALEHTKTLGAYRITRESTLHASMGSSATTGYIGDAPPVDPNAFDYQYDPEVKPQIQQQLKARLVGADKTFLFVGIGSHVSSHEDEDRVKRQQCPDWMRAFCADAHLQLSIMLLDQGFADASSDRHQVYGNQLSGHQEWKAEGDAGKVRRFGTQGISLTAYGTNLPNADFAGTSHELAGFKFDMVCSIVGKKGGCVLIGNLYNEGSPDILLFGGSRAIFDALATFAEAPKHRGKMPWLTQKYQVKE